MNRIRLVILVIFCLNLAIWPSVSEENSKVKILNETTDSITFVDEDGRIVTVTLPVERILPTLYRTTETLLAMGARDMIVGVDKTFHDRMPEFGLADLPEVAAHSSGDINYEQILELKPDIVITSKTTDADEVSKNLQGIPVACMTLTSRQDIVPELTVMGKLLGKEAEVEDLITWMDKYETIVEDRTKYLNAEDMPTFYFESSDIGKWQAITPSSSNQEGLVFEGCGGRNIAADLELEGSAVMVDAEWVLTRDPDFIFLDLMKGFDSGPGKTEEDMKNLLATYIDDRESEGFKTLTAVKNNHVYLVDRDIYSGARWVVGHVYFAKLMHPDLFEDLNPEQINKEYLSEYQGIDIEGTWVYPPPE